ncbi:VRR-NUC domain-containing protein [Bacillus siamensis]|uniref:VRR-NUC domain-containing protein n=1 Tax=Bacillus velezensis TaxID=492670 RepID=UPI0002AA63C3|nr:MULTISPECIES: VRR-NUC domain-containing protein [Bacillus amyloliquefaciens group]ARW39040.1 Putative nuclease p44 [Bacillus amyloliquefaciens]MCR6614762.1 VRR-NUC domain-containing protein [Bacillus amyloliquefaciens]MED0754136.1 VRR-NUC domain-containing protein [Bacillus amyloliquefaciens]UUA83076.1 VRR-NUC domain-containing protein [Bacillus siamensis]WJM59993.1 VRR-NUC domain-containing protein [Bacillus amyloliquefaciens]
MKESQLERILKREVERQGGKAMKFISPGLSGVPDRIVLLPGGKLVFVEMKAPGEKPRPLQLKRKKDLETMGFEVRVLDSIDSITAFVRGAFREIQTTPIPRTCN